MGLLNGFKCSGWLSVNVNFTSQEIPDLNMSFRNQVASVLLSFKKDSTNERLPKNARYFSS